MNRRFQLTICFVLASLVLSIAAAEAGESAGRKWAVVTKSAAAVHGERVLLGDIARPYGPMPEESWRRLAAVELWASPAEGSRPVVVNSRTLEGLLHKYLGKTARMVSVPGSITIQRGGWILSREEIEDKLVEFLTERVRGMEGETRLRDFNGPRAVFLDREFSRLDISVSGKLAPGRVNVNFAALTVDGRVIRRFRASMFLDQWRAVPCAARPVNPGDVLTPDMISYQRKNVAYLKGDVWDGRGEEMRVRRPVGEGMVLYADNVEGLPLIMRGSKVQLVYRGKTLRLSVEAEALEDGGFGDQITVRNLQSGRQVTAQVWDSGTVVVR